MDDRFLEHQPAICAALLSPQQVVRQESQEDTPEDVEEDGRLQDEGPSEEGPSRPKRRPSSLTDLLGQTFSVVRVVAKSAHTRAEEEVWMYQEASSLPLSDDPLSW
ncbi:hypothetical protein AAFF_G00062360 [Aldrovandia affinis]|uniref:Uncharacterized protein n=1 Tax=Aldrovandia affinis TaxID=143900 RepID=A0AAD7S013_9TELE|nr:hypothetical protein AAFF_G00062360 [Aldrovandia affinis]